MPQCPIAGDANVTDRTSLSALSPNSPLFRSVVNLSDDESYEWICRTAFTFLWLVVHLVVDLLYTLLQGRREFPGIWPSPKSKFPREFPGNSVETQIFVLFHALFIQSNWSFSVAQQTYQQTEMFSPLTSSDMDEYRTLIRILANPKLDSSYFRTKSGKLVRKKTRQLWSIECACIWLNSTKWGQ